MWKLQDTYSDFQSASLSSANIIRQNHHLEFMRSGLQWSPRKCPAVVPLVPENQPQGSFLQTSTVSLQTLSWYLSSSVLNLLRSPQLIGYGIYVILKYTIILDIYHHWYPRNSSGMPQNFTSKHVMANVDPLWNNKYREFLVSCDPWYREDH